MSLLQNSPKFLKASFLLMLKEKRLAKLSKVFLANICFECGIDRTYQQGQKNTLHIVQIFLPWWFFIKNYYSESLANCKTLRSFFSQYLF
jgi:hypothetical protein